MDSLSWQIVQRYEMVKQKDDSFKRKMAVTKALKARIQTLFQPSLVNVVPFGSSVTGLCLEGSDLDLVVLVDMDTFSKDSILNSLQDIMDDLESNLDANGNQEQIMFGDFELISSSTIPLLRFEASNTDVKIELSISNTRSRMITQSLLSPHSNECGMSKDESAYLQRTTNEWNTHLLMSYNTLLRYQGYPVLKVLGIVLKDWAKHHALLGTYYYRLSGYGLMLMLIFYLQQKGLLPCLQQKYEKEFGLSAEAHNGSEYSFGLQKDILATERNIANANMYALNKTIGTLLKGFFDFYATFDYYRIMSIRTKEHSRRSDIFYEGNRNGEWCKQILIEDPIFRYNVARSTNNQEVRHRIVRTFQRSSLELKVVDNLHNIFYLKEDDPIEKAIQDSYKKDSNLIIFNVPKMEMEDEDYLKTASMDIFKKSGADLNSLSLQDIKVSRIGNEADVKHRPIRVDVGNKKVRDEIIRKGANIKTRFGTISIDPDRTANQRKVYSDLIQEAKKRNNVSHESHKEASLKGLIWVVSDKINPRLKLVPSKKQTGKI